LLVFNKDRSISCISVEEKGCNWRERVVDEILTYSNHLKLEKTDRTYSPPN
jgi:hypothetical protein